MRKLFYYLSILFGLSFLGFLIAMFADVPEPWGWFAGGSLALAFICQGLKGYFQKK